MRDIAAADRVSARLPADQAGVLVDAVREGGWAALGHLADGDMLLDDRWRGGGQRRSGTEEDGQDRRRRSRGSVVLKVRRGIRTFFVELETGWR